MRLSFDDGGTCFWPSGREGPEGKAEKDEGDGVGWRGVEEGRRLMAMVVENVQPRMGHHL